MIDLLFGDCLDILPTLDMQVDAIITDLPYGTTACKWDVVIPFEPMWKQVKRLLKPHGAFVTTASQPFTSLLVCSNLAWFRHNWIWDKDKAGNILSSKYQPMRVHEDIIVFSYMSCVFNRQMTDANPKNIRPSGKLYKDRTGIIGTRNWQHSKDRDNTKRNPKSVIRISSVSGKCNNLNRIHPTQKPIALYEYLIRTYTNEGDTMMDFCMGSGTTGIACINTGRNFIGIEKDAGYFEIAKMEIEKAQRQLALPMVTA